MKIKVLKQTFAVCQVKTLEKVNVMDEFVFIQKTPEELSVVCIEESIPEDYTAVEYGWGAMKIEGVLDFSLVGILAKIATVLASEEISIFAISTYNTDYILIKEEQLKKATQALQNQGYVIV